MKVFGNEMSPSWLGTTTLESTTLAITAEITFKEQALCDTKYPLMHFVYDYSINMLVLLVSNNLHPDPSRAFASRGLYSKTKVLSFLLAFAVSVLLVEFLDCVQTCHVF